MVALTDTHALCKQRSLKPELKPSFFSFFFFCPISINHSSPEALAVGD